MVSLMKVVFSSTYEPRSFPFFNSFRLFLFYWYSRSY